MTVENEQVEPIESKLTEKFSFKKLSKFLITQGITLNKNSLIIAGLVVIAAEFGFTLQGSAIEKVKRYLSDKNLKN